VLSPLDFVNEKSLGNKGEIIFRRAKEKMSTENHKRETVKQKNMAKQKGKSKLRNRM
jgi:hypothetical protein